MEQFKFPEFKTSHYTLNLETGKYQKQPDRIAFNKLPLLLKVETTMDPRIRSNGATEIITGPVRNGKRTFFTGLLPVFNGSVWYYGNDYQNTPQGKKNSIVVFQFSGDNQTLTVYYFNGYYKHSSQERIKFVTEFIKHKGDQ